MIKYAQTDDHSKTDGLTGCQGASFIQINRLHSAIFPLWKFLTEESYVLLVSNRRSGCGQSCDCVDHSRRFVCGSVRCPTRNCVSSAAGTWSLARVRKCPVAIAGHLHLLIDPGAGQLGHFVRRVCRTPAWDQEPVAINVVPTFRNDLLQANWRAYSAWGG